MDRNLATSSDQRWQRKPSWIRTGRSILDPQVARAGKELESYNIRTVCKEAACPNRSECWRHRSFTFILMGRYCTRMCPFCNIESVEPEPLDHDEPQRIARFIASHSLNHCVITSVTRDDLPDGGAGHFCATIDAIRAVAPDLPIELLIPDFGGEQYFRQVIDKHPAILGHNIETVERLYPVCRPAYSYKHCLGILSLCKQYDAALPVKSAILAGLGESTDDLHRTMRDLRDAGCDIVYIGQYLAPSKRHHPVAKYYTPEEFTALQQYGSQLGLRKVLAGPLVRSSYRSWEALGVSR